MGRRTSNLNTMPLGECYAFELGIIIRNRPEDGMRGSTTRREAASRELARRAGQGDQKAVTALRDLGEEWTDADTARIRELREQQELSSDELDELRALRRRETVETFRRRRAQAAR